jgi:hypothetical protein
LGRRANSSVLAAASFMSTLKHSMATLQTALRCGGPPALPTLAAVHIEMSVTTCKFRRRTSRNRPRTGRASLACAVFQIRGLGSLLAQHQERDQRRDGSEGDRNGEDVGPRHAGSSAMPHGLRQGCQHSILALAAVQAKALCGPSLPWPLLLPRPPPRPPLVLSSRGLVLPPNFRDVTARKVGTVMAIVGATAAGKGTKPG